MTDKNNPTNPTDTPKAPVGFASADIVNGTDITDPHGTNPAADIPPPAPTASDITSANPIKAQEPTKLDQELSEAAKSSQDPQYALGAPTPPAFPASDPVDPGKVVGVVHDHEALEVRYENGDRIVYDNVPQNRYQQLLGTGDVEAFIEQYIKAGRTGRNVGSWK